MIKVEKRHLWKMIHLGVGHLISIMKFFTWNEVFSERIGWTRSNSFLAFREPRVNFLQSSFWCQNAEDQCLKIEGIWYIKGGSQGWGCFLAKYCQFLSLAFIWIRSFSNRPHSVSQLSNVYRDKGLASKLRYKMRIVAGCFGVETKQQTIRLQPGMPYQISSRIYVQASRASHDSNKERTDSVV